MDAKRRSRGQNSISGRPLSTWLKPDLSLSETRQLRPIRWKQNLPFWACWLRLYLLSGEKVMIPAMIANRSFWLYVLIVFDCFEKNKKIFWDKSKSTPYWLERDFRLICWLFIWKLSIFELTNDSYVIFMSHWPLSDLLSGGPIRDQFRWNWDEGGIRVWLKSESGPKKRWGEIWTKIEVQIKSGLNCILGWGGVELGWSWGEIDSYVQVGQHCLAQFL